MVRPIEMQDLFSKTQAAERVHQMQKAAPEQAQRTQQAANEEEAVVRQKKPNPSDETNEPVLHKEPRERRRRRGGSREEQGAENKEAVYSANEDRSGMNADPEKTGESVDGDDHSHIDVVV